MSDIDPKIVRHLRDAQPDLYWLDSDPLEPLPHSALVGEVQADLLIVAGTISKKLGPILKQVYEQMSEPKWVLAVGACASSGGIFDTYSVLQGIDRIIPVDVYVPGCPPRPEQIIDGIMKIHELVKHESLRRRDSEEYKAMLHSYNIEIDAK